ncbi:MAG: alpha/beta hydrolase [Acidobacteria bacterium]|nr:alpha/beta hydrolase [Acidobacteriota bacterium]MCB9399372.1 alpha/beta hydrolase [Acidobacteriota bacterium]
MKVSVYYEVIGEGAKAILVSPGLTQTCANWRTLCRQNPQYTWVVYDPRGQGKSPLGEQPYQLDDHVEDLLGVLDQTGIKKPLLAGFSHGGRVSIRAVTTYPHLFDRLLLVSTATHVSPWRKATLRSWYECLVLGGVEGLAWCSLPTIVGPKILNKFEDPEFLVKGTVHRNNREGLLAMFEGLKNYPNALDDLPNISLPTLFLRGEQDQLVTFEDERNIARFVAKAEWASHSDCGHTVSLEDSEWFLGQIQRFFPA